MRLFLSHNDQHYIVHINHLSFFDDIVYFLDVQKGWMRARVDYQYERFTHVTPVSRRPRHSLVAHRRGLCTQAQRAAEQTHSNKELAYYDLSE